MATDCATRRTARRAPQVLDDVGVDPRRFHVGVSQILLYLTDVHPVQEQVRGKAVSQRVDETGL